MWLLKYAFILYFASLVCYTCILYFVFCFNIITQILKKLLNAASRDKGNTFRTKALMPTQLKPTVSVVQFVFLHLHIICTYILWTTLLGFHQITSKIASKRGPTDYCLPCTSVFLLLWTFNSDFYFGVVYCIVIASHGCKKQTNSLCRCSILRILKGNLIISIFAKIYKATNVWDPFLKVYVYLAFK